ncbi:SH3 domain-containing protein [Rhizobium paknamense]|uniref:Uncharacterized protein YraI n=1 Tax=Rhizobium paknamense TaxID=1206817 RepID=A0ABU0IFN3_9HYPH|nr:SH3 domain-containing protein [Rhizobium paknamense]MDQ0456502.1 uncharacterized protein YraI [Rhizobium paknamense]
MKPVYLTALAGLMAVALPVAAQAAQAVATANVNLRAGPSTQYPPVLVVPAGNRVDIYGCLATANWCDVAYAGYRGWISGSYLQTVYAERRIYVDPDYYRPLGIPIITFSVGDYWDRYYRGRDFYRERDRWRRAPPAPPVWHRGDDRLPPPPMDGRRPGDWDRRDPRRGPDMDRPDRRPPPDMNRPDRRPPQDMDRPDRRPPPQAERPDRRPPPPPPGSPPPGADRRPPPPWVKPPVDNQ